MQKQKPLVLYKYSAIQKKLLSSLESGKLWVSSPDKFNDPFDCALPVLRRTSPRKATKVTLKFLELARNMTESARRQAIRLAKKGQIYRSNRIAKLLNTRKRNCGILCFSETSDDLLMWAHYGDLHKGMCLGFDSNKYWFDQAQHVDYSKILPSLDIADLMAGSEKPWKSLFLTKSKHWKYEREWRFLHLDPLFRGANDKARLITFEKPALKQVIFGCKTTNKNINRVRSALRDWPAEIEFFEARMHSSKFALSIRRLDD